MKVECQELGGAGFFYGHRRFASKIRSPQLSTWGRPTAEWAAPCFPEASATVICKQLGSFGALRWIRFGGGFHLPKSFCFPPPLVGLKKSLSLLDIPGVLTKWKEGKQLKQRAEVTMPSGDTSGRPKRGAAGNLDVERHDSMALDIGRKAMYHFSSSHV